MATVPRDNQQDIDLFDRDPNAFFAFFQEKLQIIVKTYIRCGMFKPQDFDDILQTLNETLLVRLPSLKAHFNRSTTLRTYLSAVVRNLCIDLYHHQNRQHQLRTIPFQEAFPSPHTDFVVLYDIHHIRRLFQAILKQFDYKLELPRLLLCLKLRYRIPIVREDIIKWYPGCERNDIRRLLRNFSGNYENLTDAEISRRITPLLNMADGRENTPEAILRWTKERVDNILELLNGSPPTASFDEETLKILLDDFFSPFLTEIP
jgi:DNA-directed RNA polymerase specialized sigma24 family protein